MKLWVIFAAGVLALCQFGSVSASGCYDNDDYRYYDDHWKDCSWIAANNRCNRVKNGKHVGKDYCPYSCGYCSVPKPTSPSNSGQCYDDDDFRYKEYSYKDCDWMHEKGLCGAWYNGKHVGKYYCPKSCGYCHAPSPTRSPTNPTKPPSSPTQAPHGQCYDDEDYRWYGDDWKDCEWIEKHGRCERWRHGKHVGKYFCPRSCGYCHQKPSPTPAPAPKPTQPKCYDDEDYRYYGDSWKDCEWIKRHGRCDRWKNGKHIGSYYCPKSCGYCERSNPAPSPTRKPTPEPTHKSCDSYVDVEHHCYDKSDDTIVISFSNCDPRGRDWIGIYRKGSSYSGSPVLWVFTCGTKYCSSTRGSSSVYFDDWALWLHPGEYVAYLFHHDGYDVKATTDTSFWVKGGYDGCSHY